MSSDGPYGRQGFNQGAGYGGGYGYSQPQYGYNAGGNPPGGGAPYTGGGGEYSPYGAAQTSESFEVSAME
jgi:hypothetical protein